MVILSKMVIYGYSTKYGYSAKDGYITTKDGFIKHQTRVWFEFRKINFNYLDNHAKFQKFSKFFVKWQKR